MIKYLIVVSGIKVQSSGAGNFVMIFFMQIYLMPANISPGFILIGVQLNPGVPGMI